MSSRTGSPLVSLLTQPRGLSTGGFEFFGECRDPGPKFPQLGAGVTVIRLLTATRLGVGIPIATLVLFRTLERP